MNERLVQYRRPSGEIISRWYPLDVQAPDVVDGAVQCGWPPIKRPKPRRHFNVIQDERPVVSNSSPRWHGMKAGKGKGFYDTYTKDGKPVITSRAALREAQVRASYQGEQMARCREVYSHD